MGDYAVQVASESNAWREPIVRRTDLGPERIYYRTMVGPFVLMEDATESFLTDILALAGEEPGTRSARGCAWPLPTARRSSGHRRRTNA